MTNDETNQKNIPVQEITQQAFNEMNDDRKKFYQDLIKKGQVKITDTEKDNQKQRQREDVRSPFSWLRNQNIEVKFTSGDTIAGLLTDVWQYEIAIKTPDGSVLIMKHAIRTVRKIPGDKDKDP